MSKVKPSSKGCTKAEPTFFGLLKGGHDWHHNYWGVHKEHAPFAPSGGRGGWRCRNCGEYVWDEPDNKKFGVMELFYTDHHYRSLYYQKMGLDRWGRELNVYDKFFEYFGKPFRVVDLGYAIEVRCGSSIVARWSSGDRERDYFDYIEWKKLTEADVLGNVAYREDAA
jgi:hypothetical protein